MGFRPKLSQAKALATPVLIIHHSDALKRHIGSHTKPKDTEKTKKTNTKPPIATPAETSDTPLDSKARPTTPKPPFEPTRLP
jgi:hypothetical protein